MSSLLVHLPEDTWAILAKELESDDLLRLWLTGSHHVHWRLVASCEEFKATFNSVGFIPVEQYGRFARRFPKIRSMSIAHGERMKETMAMRPANWEFFPTSLQSLTLRFSQSLSTLLGSPHYDPSHFPLLETLHVTTRRDQWDDAWKKMFPPSLTSLSLKGVSGIYPLSMISTLPRGLRKLAISDAKAHLHDLESRIIDEPPVGPQSRLVPTSPESISSKMVSSSDITPSRSFLVVFPPELEILKIWLDSNPLIRRRFPPHFLPPCSLPRSLTTFRVINYDMGIFDDDRWKDLPPNLRSIDFGFSFAEPRPWSYFALKLPSSVTKMHLPCNGYLGFPMLGLSDGLNDPQLEPSQLDKKEKVDLSPTALNPSEMNQVISFIGRLVKISRQSTPRLLHLFEQLQSALIYDDPPSYPPNLKHLITHYIVRAPQVSSIPPLPSTLQSLIIFSLSSFHYTFSNSPRWPATLQTLSSANQVFDISAVKLLPPGLQTLVAPFLSLSCLLLLPPTLTSLEFGIRPNGDSDKIEDMPLDNAREEIQRVGGVTLATWSSTTSITSKHDSRSTETTKNQVRSTEDAIHADTLPSTLKHLEINSSVPEAFFENLSSLKHLQVLKITSSLYKKETLRWIGSCESLNSLTIQVLFSIHDEELACFSSLKLRKLSIGSEIKLLGAMNVTPDGIRSLPRSLTSLILPRFSSVLLDPEFDEALPPGLSFLQLGKRWQSSSLLGEDIWRPKNRWSDRFKDCKHGLYSSNSDK